MERRWERPRADIDYLQRGMCPARTEYPRDSGRDSPGFFKLFPFRQTFRPPPMYPRLVLFSKPAHMRTHQAIHKRERK
eukprot:1326019-Amorphochlora_amoeboformis.AAC.1